MAEKDDAQTTIVKTSRGLSIAGTRITLSQVMDYVQAGWPPKLMQHWLNLSEQQVTDVMHYIETHRDEVEAEYKMVLQQAEENRQYWETRNRERFATIASLPPSQGRKPSVPSCRRGKPSGTEVITVPVDHTAKWDV